jgi:hypothetical protein
MEQLTFYVIIYTNYTKLFQVGGVNMEYGILTKWAVINFTWASGQAALLQFSAL